LPCCLCGRRQQDRCRRRRAAELMITGGEKHTAAAAHSARDHWRPPSTREHAAGCQPGRRPPAHTLLAGIHRQQLVAGGKSKQAGGRSAKAGRHDGTTAKAWNPAAGCLPAGTALSQPRQAVSQRTIVAAARRAQQPAWPPMMEQLWPSEPYAIRGHFIRLYDL
jgi:hypothetical protein